MLTTYIRLSVLMGFLATIEAHKGSDEWGGIM